jgi:hypothetical protein
MYTGPSIVDYLNSIGQPSDYSSRAVLARQKGIQNYTGTADQNTQLLGILRTPAVTQAPPTAQAIDWNALFNLYAPKADANGWSWFWIGDINDERGWRYWRKENGQWVQKANKYEAQQAYVPPAPAPKPTPAPVVVPTPAPVVVQKPTPAPTQTPAPAYVPGVHTVGARKVVAPKAPKAPKAPSHAIRKKHRRVAGWTYYDANEHIITKEEYLKI